MNIDKTRSKRVLIMQPGALVHYRIGIFNLLAKECDLTVGYLDPCKIPDDIEFKVIKFDFSTLFKLRIIKDFRKICSLYDIVIIFPHYRNLSFCILPYLNRNYKLIGWSNGQRANYKTQFDLERKKTFSDYITANILKRCDANVIYVREAIEWLSSFGIPKETIFAVQNTAVVESIAVEPSLKKSILFVGSLYKKKGLDELINCYYKAYKSHLQDAPQLDIVGKGEEEYVIKEMAQRLGLEKKVTFWGAVYDESQLCKYFAKALICVSPKQAGLSVLKSMGYGCPFITRRDAITGGEIVNIKDGETGLLYDSEDRLVSIFDDVFDHPQKYIEMGYKAKSYFDNFASPQIMVKGFLDAFDFVSRAQ